jgi:hypothetical protein
MLLHQCMIAKRLEVYGVRSNLKTHYLELGLLQALNGLNRVPPHALQTTSSSIKRTCPERQSAP